jgi:hypothetical protein
MFPTLSCVPLGSTVPRDRANPKRASRERLPTRQAAGSVKSVLQGKNIESRLAFVANAVLCSFFCLPENVTAGDPESGYHDCPMGYYCPNGTGLDWMPCPKGTYSQQTHLFRVRLSHDVP